MTPPKTPLRGGSFAVPGNSNNNQKSSDSDHIDSPLIPNTYNNQKLLEVQPVTDGFYRAFTIL